MLPSTTSPSSDRSCPRSGVRSGPKSPRKVQSEYKKTAIKVQSEWNQLFHVPS